MPLPDVSEAFWDLSTAIQFIVVAKAASDFELTEAKRAPVSFQGILMPLTPQKLKIVPEGQRSWKWWTLFTKEALTLDWLIQDFNGKKYRVMERADWHSGGYSQYELIENPTV